MQTGQSKDMTCACHRIALTNRFTKFCFVTYGQCGKYSQFVTIKSEFTIKRDYLFPVRVGYISKIKHTRF